MKRRTLVFVAHVGTRLALQLVAAVAIAIVVWGAPGARLREVLAFGSAGAVVLAEVIGIASLCRPRRNVQERMASGATEAATGLLCGVSLPLLAVPGTVQLIHSLAFASFLTLASSGRLRTPRPSLEPLRRALAAVVNAALGVACGLWMGAGEDVAARWLVAGAALVAFVASMAVLAQMALAVQSQTRAGAAGGPRQD